MTLQTKILSGNSFFLLKAFYHRICIFHFFFAVLQHSREGKYNLYIQIKYLFWRKKSLAFSHNNSPAVYVWCNGIQTSIAALFSITLATFIYFFFFNGYSPSNQLLNIISFWLSGTSRAGYLPLLIGWSTIFLKKLADLITFIIRLALLLRRCVWQRPGFFILIYPHRYSLLKF